MANLSLAHSAMFSEVHGRGPGLRVRLKSIDLTKKGVLSKPYYFQCPPMEEFAVDWLYEHADYMTISAGEFSRRSGRKLRTVSFDTLATDGQYPWMTERGPAGREEYREGLRDVMLSGTPFHLLVTDQYGGPGDTSVRMDMEATLRGLRVVEKAGEEDTFYFGCQFVEFRDPLISRGRAKPASKKWPRTVTLFKDRTYLGVSTNNEPLTLRVIATYLYQRPDLASSFVANAVGTRNWGPDTPLADHPKFRGKTTKIVLPGLPEATAAPSPALHPFDFDLRDDAI
jgi:hypothetical protein